MNESSELFVRSFYIGERLGAFGSGIEGFQRDKCYSGVAI